MIREKVIAFRGSRSQEEMGNMYNVSQQTWSNWERGLKNPSISRMKQIEVDSGLPMEELFWDIFNKLKLSKTIVPSITTISQERVICQSIKPSKGGTKCF